MSTTWITTVTFAATALIVVALVSAINDLFLRYRTLLNERLEDLSSPVELLTGRKSLFKERRQPRDGSLVSVWRGRVEDYREQAGLKFSLKQFCGIALGMGAILAAVGTATTGQWWMAPLGFMLGLGLPVTYVFVKRRARMQRLVAQLPKALDIIRRTVQAGQTVPAAFQIVADDLRPPIADEFRACYEQQRLGMSFETAMRNLARRTGIMELRILAVALVMQSRSGGNLVGLLSNLSTTVTKRLKLRQRIRALTGEGRMQATVLMVLPVAVFGMLLVTAPNYIATLLEYPWLIAATVGAQLIGAFWIRRYTHFKY